MFNKKGFTLIEIMIVIIILGIIAAIAIPKFAELREKKNKRGMNPLQQMNQKVQVNSDTALELNQLGPGVYEVWVKECNKFIKIKVSDVGG